MSLDAIRRELYEMAADLVDTANRLALAEDAVEKELAMADMAADKLYGGSE